MRLYCIYELTPAPWGDNHRYIVGYDNREDAEEVLKCLNSVNTIFDTFIIIEWKE